MASQRKSVTSPHDAPHLLGGTAIKPVERHGLERIRYFFHNPETGAFCTRTPKSWLLIFLFYCIYYTCLAGFWYGMMNVFFLTLSDDAPKYTLSESIIGVNPGMGVRPRQADPRIDSSMYYFKGNWDGQKATEEIEEDSDAGFATRLQYFLERTLVEGQPHAVDCSEEELNKPRQPNQPPCKFESSNFGPCVNFPYGYSSSSLNPCIIVKLNKIFGLVPTPYEPTDELPEGIPEEIVARIKDTNEPRRVYIECHGENAADVEALKDIKYFPNFQGVPMGFFPHQNKDNLVSPAIAVQFSDVPHGQLIHIECRAWFKGVVHDRKERMGLVHFELMIE